MQFGGTFFQTKLLSRLSHKVCGLLSSPVLLRKLTTRQNRLRGRLRQVWLLTLALLRLDQRLGRRCVRLHHGNVLKDVIARPIAIASLHHLVDVLNRYLFNNIYLFTIANKAD